MRRRLLTAPKKERELAPRYYAQLLCTSRLGEVMLYKHVNTHLSPCKLHGDSFYHYVDDGDKKALCEWYGVENVYDSKTMDTKTGKYFMTTTPKVTVINDNTLLLYWQAGKYANEGGSFYRQAKYRWVISKIPQKLKDDIKAGANVSYYGGIMMDNIDYVDQAYTPTNNIAPLTKYEWGDQLPFPTATVGTSVSGGSFTSAVVGDTAKRTITIHATDVEDAKKYAIITSSNPDVVDINADLTLNIKNAGTATITVEWPQMNGKYIPYKASWTINVAASISWEVENGDLNKAILNEDEANRYVKLNGLPEENKLRLVYQSSDPTVATIDESGKITLISAGSVTITATLPANDDYAEELTKSFTLTVVELKFSHSENKTFDDESAPYEWYDGNWTGHDLGIICDERVPEGKMIQSSAYLFPSMSFEDAPLLFFNGTDETGKNTELNMYSDGFVDGGLIIYLADGTMLKNEVLDGKKYPLYSDSTINQNGNGTIRSHPRSMYIMNPADAKRYIRKHWLGGGLLWSTTDTPVQLNIKINFDNPIDLESRFK